MFALLLCFLSATSVAKEKVFTFHAGSEPPSIDPQLVDDVDGNILAIQLFEGLTTYDAKGKTILPAVAKRWEISPDGKTYTFYLREDAKWSDGTAVTAQDFWYAWERLLNPKTGAMQATRLEYLKNGKDYIAGKLKDPSQLGMKVVGPHTFRVELENPFPPFLANVSNSSFFPVKKVVVEKYGDQWTKSEHIVSNGPFMLTEWKPYERLVMKKNPHYWDAKNVELEEVVAVITESLETALKRYFANEIDFDRHLPQTQISALSRRPDCYATYLFGTYYYPVNTKHPTLKDVRVRLALSLAIDRKSLVEQVLRTGEKPATGLVPPGLSDYPYRNLIQYDSKKAKQLLTAAGYPNGTGFPILTVSYNTMERHKMIAESIQQMWKKNLGIEVKLLNQEWKVHVSQVRGHKFEIARFGGIGEYLYPTTFLEGYVTNTPGNDPQWSNAQFDALWYQAHQEADLKKRLRLYAKLEEILLSEMPVIPLFFYVENWLTKPHVKNLYVSPMNVIWLKYVKLVNR